MIRTAEFVFPGHPDKLSDAIADALVQEAIRREPRALVGVEVAIHRDEVFITGRIACTRAADIDVEALVRGVYASAGYSTAWYPAPEQVRVTCNLCRGDLEEGEAEFREVSDDQAICIGYANDLEATGHLPMEQWLVRAFTQRLVRLRQEQPGLALGPDGKVIVVLQEDDHFQARAGQGVERVPRDEEPSAGHAAIRWKLLSLSCSLQQMKSADDVALHRVIRQALVQELQRLAGLLPGLSAEFPRELHVNGAGAFEVGGPEGDNGLSGKKLVMDAYGPRVPIGGGAWSGKDFFKADRAGGLHARRMALMAIRLGLARECTVHLAWFPGDAQARVLSVVDERGEGLPVYSVRALESWVDRSLKRSGERFWNTEPDSQAEGGLLDLARWGHFGRADVVWERAVQV